MIVAAEKWAPSRRQRELCHKQAAASGPRIGRLRSNLSEAYTRQE